MIAKMTSLAVTPKPSSPVTSTSMFFDCFRIRVWVASVCSTSLVPIPKAKAPNAPCVLVWLSPQTMVAPGTVKPCSGPTICTTPWRGSIMSNSGTPNSLAFARSVSTWMRLSSSSIPSARPLVGTLWSGVARVRSGRRTLRPAIRKPSNAWGLVTSWTRWRST